MKISYFEVDKKVKGIKNFKLRYPKLNFGRGKTLLFVSDISPEDDKKVFLGKDTGIIMQNALKFAMERSDDNATGEIFFINYYPFSYEKLEEYPPNVQAKIKDRCHKRFVKILEKIRPDTIFFAGLELAKKYQFTKYTLQRLPLRNKSRLASKEMRYLRGRVLPVKIGEYECNSVASMSLSQACTLIQKKYGLLNLLGFFINDLEIALRGEDRYTLPFLKGNDWYKIIRTMDDWNSFFEKLKNSDYNAMDTEGENLNRVYNNNLLTIQWGLDGQSGYILPWRHVESPFNDKQLVKIGKDIQYYYEECRSKFNILHNAKYDFLQLRAVPEINVRYYNHDIFDTQTGLYFLDENRKGLSEIGLKAPFALGNDAFEFGGFGYIDTVLGKADRADLKSKKLVDVSEYGALDTVYPFQMAKFCLQEAKRRGPQYAGYKKAVTKLGSEMTHVFIDIEHNGIKVDKDYLKSLMRPDSFLNKQIKEEKEKIKEFQTAKEANAIIAREAGFKSTGGLYGKKAKVPWIFDINKQKHAQTLFFDVLGLKPLDYRKNGQGKIDKKFILEYIKISPEVETLEHIKKQEKVYNTNVKGYYKILEKDGDASVDNRIRSHYNFIRITSSRSGSTNPNGQNVPNHGPYAKPIKKQFNSDKYKLIIDYDLNANEVKNWGNIADDPVVESAFKPGILLRRNMRIWAEDHADEIDDFVKYLCEVKWFEKPAKGGPDIETKRKLAKGHNRFTIPLGYLVDLEIDGDVHRRNANLFFGTPTHEVNPVQRQSVKAVIFGVLYGKSGYVLAKDLYQGEANAAIEKLKAATDEGERKKLQKEVDYLKHLANLERKYHTHEELVKSDEYKIVKDRGQDLIDKLFSTMKKGGKWIKDVQEIGREKSVVPMPTGMNRHLWAYMHTDESLRRAMDRRGPNAVVQGPSSNINFISARLLQRYNFEFQKAGFDIGLVHNNSIHDANYFDNYIVTLPIAMYYIEHCAVNEICKYCEDIFDWRLRMAPEIAFSMGPNLAEMNEFNFTRPSLEEGVSKTIDYQNENYGYNLNKKKLLKAVVHNWDIMNKFRIKELKQMEDNVSGGNIMLMPVEKAITLPFIWNKKGKKK